MKLRYIKDRKDSGRIFLREFQGADHMEKMFVVGNENFDEFIKENGYYVDKTELLYELAEKTRNKVTLFTRPRRFGKTLTMSMMESFFDINRDSREVFRGLNILNHPEFCAKWMNQYPVLFLSFKDVEGLDFEGAYGMLKDTLASVCKRYVYLRDSEKALEEDKEIFNRLISQKAKPEEIKTSLTTIMRMMNAVHGRPVILLVDEYDVPLAKAEAAKCKEFYRRMLDIVRGLMSTALKTNEYLKFAVITGCLRISKESIFTGVNNFACYSVLNRRFSQYFGFTQEEVAEMLDYAGLDEKSGIITEWYDGYIFGNSEVFCPWDVVSYLASVIDGEEEEPQNFWANTSGNIILDDFINHPEIDVFDKFETLLNGGIISEEILQELTYDHLGESEKNLWSVLLMTGYVSKADKNSRKGKIKLKIPNAEIAEIFRDAVVARFNRTLDASKVKEFITAMWNKDENGASISLTDILWNSISYFDYGEEYYHGILNGLFTSRGYTVDSNDEAGLGRLDLRVRDRANRRILLLEFKRSKKEAELDKDCDVAIGQMIKNGYARIMPEGYEQQVVYGIAFFGKKAKVRLGLS